LSILKKTIKTTKTQVFLDRIGYGKRGADINFFLITYIRSRTSKFIGSTSKQDNNTQTQVLSMPQAGTSETPVNISQTAPV
jgi:hypothetical protein